MNEKTIKVIGIAATIIGTAMSLVSSWVDEKKTDEKIEKKVKEAFAKMGESA